MFIVKTLTNTYIPRSNTNLKYQKKIKHLVVVFEFVMKAMKVLALVRGVEKKVKYRNGYKDNKV